MEILFDLDHVVCDMGQPLLDAIGKETGHFIKEKDVWTYNLPNIYGLPIEELFSFVVKHEVLENALPVRGSVELLHRLQDAGYKLHFCTNRDFHPAAEEMTQEWFDEHAVPYDTITINSHGRCKATVCGAELGVDKFAYMVEDHWDNLKQSMGSGLVQQGILLNRPWNANVVVCKAVRHHNCVVDFLRELLD